MSDRNINQLRHNLTYKSMKAAGSDYNTNLWPVIGKVYGEMLHYFFDNPVIVAEITSKVGRKYYHNDLFNAGMEIIGEIDERCPDVTKDEKEVMIKYALAQDYLYHWSVLTQEIKEEIKE